jgi:hypothetical protein
MNYSSYHNRKAGDRVVDQAGKSGTVTEIQKRNTSGEAIAVRWDDGSIALNYAAPRHLRLLANGRLSTKPSAKKIPRTRLADMLKERALFPHTD